jgi:hypothetical protein
MTALTTTSARRAKRRIHRLEAGVARAVDEVDLAVVPLDAQLEPSDICRLCSSSSQSATVVPSSIEPSRFVFPAWKSSPSTSEVFPTRGGPDGDVADLARLANSWHDCSSSSVSTRRRI